MAMPESRGRRRFPLPILGTSRNINGTTAAKDEFVNMRRAE